MLDRPRNGTAAVLVGLDFGEADYAEGLQEIRELTASAGVTDSPAARRRSRLSRSGKTWGSAIVVTGAGSRP